MGAGSVGLVADARIQGLKSLFVFRNDAHPRIMGFGLGLIVAAMADRYI